MRLRQAQYFAQLAVNIVRRLRRRPEREFATNRVTRIGFPACNAGVRLDWRVIVALVEKPVLAHVVGCSKTCINFAKLK